ncbi:MAG: ATP-binding protein [Mariprofundus sp.]|nr:ATP-binding protein [Mariprofundus sp.]
MYRHQSHLIDLWFEQQTHKPLVLRGARQVGKSTLIRLFAEQRKLELVELNFERNPEYADLFASNDPKQIVAAMRLMLNKSLRQGSSILFLDEIQAAPKTLASLRYFYEEMPNLHIIAAGSLLDFELASPSFSMPVGRISYMHLHPMNFTEFLRAVGEMSLAEYIETWQIDDDLPAPLHGKLMGLLRQCMAIGGMPEVVKSFAELSDYRQAEQIKQDLLATFTDDFAKYARNQDQELIRLAFRKAPTLIGRKVKYSEINKGMPTPRVAQALNQLDMARVIHKVLRSAANGIPLSAEENIKFLKLLFLDVGLVSTMMNVSWQALQEDLLLINQGALAEQWVGQELLSSLDAHLQPHLHYWAREAASSSAELDYVIEGDQPVAVEVKAGKSGSLKSLHLFIKEKRSPVAVRLNADIPSMMSDTHTLPDGSSRSYQLLSLPLYMAGQVRRLISS